MHCNYFTHIFLLFYTLSIAPFVWIGIVGSVIATVVGAFSNQIDDNLSVPLVVGLFAHLAIRMA